MNKSTLKLVYSKEEPPIRIKRAWIEGSSLVEERGSPFVERMYSEGPGAHRIVSYYRDKKNRRYVNIVIGDGVGPSREIMDD